MAVNENDFDVAIVGMACRFPGARNVQDFWRNLAGGVESISRLSDEEILASGVPAATLNQPNYVRAAPLLSDPGHFDAAFFGYSPLEARTMDPQQRLLLELAHEAMEDSGYDPERGQARVGVFAGTAMNTYFMSAGLKGRFAEEYIPTLIGSDKDFLSTRISYKLNLKGPSMTVQSACSTSLVALHLARQSLLSGETDLALAGAVSVRVPHRAGYLCDGGGVVSPDGHVRAFDAKANGTVFGSGGGVLVLKRLTDALASGDTVHAVIRGSSVNNDGADKAGYTAPGVNGQTDAVVEALANAGVEADTITYLEAHGSGTPVGDPIELRALTKAFRAFTQRSGFCAIGSVKANVGHLDAAAGMAGVIKTVLAMKQRQLPPSLHYTEANPAIDFPNSPFYVNTELRDWASDGPRRAGVMATGMGGTNAHVILEEAPAMPDRSNAEGAQLLVLSAKTETALDRATDRLQEVLAERPGLGMSDVAYTLQVGRRQMPFRRTVVCADRDDAVATLRARPAARVRSDRAPETPRPMIFLLPGVGDHYVGMAHDLYTRRPMFRDAVDRCAEILRPLLGIDIRTVLYPAGERWKRTGQPKGLDLRRMLGRGAGAEEPEDPESAQLNRTLYAQPALFAIEYAMTRFWQSLGVEPDAIVGHSMGEYVAACVAGVLSLEDALALIVTRARLVEPLPAGAMLAVTLPEAELRPLLDGDLSISLINGPALCVVAGPADAVARFDERLTARGTITRPVQNAHAFHSRMLDPVVEEFQKAVSRVRLQAPKVPYVSNVTGGWITGAEATDPAYWARHVNHTARFSDALHQMWQTPEPILLECGPGRTLGVLAMQHPDRPASETQGAIMSLRQRYENADDDAVMLEAAGRLWRHGAGIAWEQLHPAESRRRVPLPTYPFERQDYWLAATSESGAPPVPDGAPADETLPLDDWFYVPIWERMPALEAGVPDAPPGAGLWVVFGDRYGGGDGVRDRLSALGLDVAVVHFGDAFVRQAAGSYRVNPASPDDYVRLFRELRAGSAARVNIIHLGSLTRGEAALTPARVRASRDFGFFSLFHIAQAAGDLGLEVPITIGAISNGLHDVTGTEALNPEMSTILGPCGVIPKEFPNIACFALDLADAGPGGELPERTVASIVAEFSSGDRPPVLAYRGPYRWQRGFRRVRLPGTDPAGAGASPPSPMARPDGVYLITGGTGGIGLAVARSLAKAGRPKLVLTKKSAFPPRAEWSARAAAPDTPAAVRRSIEAILELEALGAEVEVRVVDVADGRGMHDVVRDVVGRVGAITGVIHAAGIVRAGLIQAKTRDAADQVLAPKVEGTLVLFDLLKEVGTDVLVLFSSVNSVLAPAGLADYSAANAFLDGFGSYAALEAPFRTVTIDWPGWRETGILAGMARASGAAGWERDALEKAISTRDGLDAFARIIRSRFNHVIVSPEHFNRVYEESLGDGGALVDRALPADPQRTGDAPISPVAPGDAPRDETEQRIASIWQDALGIEAVGIHDDFSTLGGHSLIAIRIVSEVRRAFEIALPVRALFDAPTVAALSDHVKAKIIAEVEAMTDEPV